jgi:ribosomal protein S18 acetylase RimI-like enzyme
MHSELDNPVWHALQGPDRDKNIGSGPAAFFDTEVAPFIGMPVWDESDQRELLRQLPSGRSCSLMIANEVRLLDDWELKLSIPLYQLTCHALADLPAGSAEHQIMPLGMSHVPEMVALAAKTKPGPFLSRTIEFGNYHGIFSDGRLVSMGGERLHTQGCTELSAICTDPEHRGRGHAATITHHLTRTILGTGKLPFLHARQDNVNALEMYQRLGFRIRASMHFALFCKR